MFSSAGRSFWRAGGSFYSLRVLHGGKRMNTAILDLKKFGIFQLLIKLPKNKVLDPDPDAAKSLDPVH